MINIKLILNRKSLRYLIVGGCNTLVGYFLGIFLYFLLINNLGIVFISIISSVVSISFSFFSYKVFVFKTSGNWLKEYVKCYMIYSGISIINISIIWFLVDIIKINIWISLALSTIIVTLLSYFGHNIFTFNIKDEKIN